MPVLERFASLKIAALEQKSLHRTLLPTERGEGAEAVRGGKSLISFADNDYLGLSRHPRVVAAMKNAEVSGAGASRLVTGNHPAYAQLEAALASLKGHEAACVFGSGYLTGVGVIPALVEKGDLILADRLIHACLIDGAKLSGAAMHRYSHNSLKNLNNFLKSRRKNYRNCLIVTEHVFGMDGDVAPLKAIAELAKEHDAWVLSDDAHGMGVVKVDDAGVDVVMGTLSKSAGSYGGYVCAAQSVIELIASQGRSVLFSTALPPSVVAASLEAVKLISEMKDESVPLARAKQFTRILGLPEAQSALVPLILGGAEKALAASQKLAEKGFLVPAIRPPTVPQKTARLRFSFSALHSEAQVAAMAEAVKALGLVAERVDVAEDDEDVA